MRSIPFDFPAKVAAGFSIFLVCVSANPPPVAAPLPRPIFQMASSSPAELVRAVEDCLSIIQSDRRFSGQGLNNRGWTQSGPQHPLIPAPNPPAFSTEYRRGKVYISIISGPTADMCLSKARIDSASAFSDVRSLLITNVGAQSYDNYAGHTIFKEHMRGKIGTGQKDNFVFLGNFVLLIQSIRADGLPVIAVQAAPLTD